MEIQTYFEYLYSLYKYGSTSEIIEKECMDILGIEDRDELRKMVFEYKEGQK